jgi:hypothetical protein
LKKFLSGRGLAVIALVIGLGLGLLWAWYISPVEWTDTDPSSMRQDLQVDYLRMVVESYFINNDEALADYRYQLLGPEREQILSQLAADENAVSSEALQQFTALVSAGGEGVTDGGEVDEGGDAQPAPEATQPAVETGPQPLAQVGLVCGLTFLLLVFLLAAIRLKRRADMASVEYEDEYIEPGMEYPSEDEAAVQYEQPTAEPGQAAVQPLATFRTTYSLGDDLYDDSFSIESPASGDFLGECGVGIGDLIGVGEPKKVSAFELWLFDKNDIQTVTKVLMSRYAYNDEASLTRLSAKGDPVLAMNGGIVELETASLRIEARVVDMSYGEAALPAESFFERITIELRALPKNP